jgi:hypothetical protein
MGRSVSRFLSNRMRPLLTVILVFYNSALLCAQEKKIVFGEVTPADFHIENKLDSAADAIMLYEKGETSNDFTYHARIKILTNAGVDRFASIKLIYYSRFGKASVEGFTYNLADNKIISSRLENTGVFKLNSIEREDQLNFAMPNVRVGSIIEYRYKISDPFTVNWAFQQDIPVLWSEYVRNRTEHAKYIIRGTTKLTQFEEKLKGQYQRWVMTHLAAFKDEPDIFDKPAYISRLEFFYPLKSWGFIRAGLLRMEQFGLAANGDEITDEVLNKIIYGIDNPILKMKFITAYIKENVKWSGVQDFWADSPTDVLSRKRGTSGDINILLCAMLKRAGLKTDLIILSTRENGLVHQDLINIEQFNYVICRVTIDNITFLVDATEKLLPFDVLPERCLNHFGLLIDEKKENTWVEIKPNAKSKTAVSCDFILQADGILQGTKVVKSEGYDAADQRELLHNEEKFFKDILSEKPWELKRRSVEGFKDIYSPLKVTYDLVVTNHAVLSSDLIYFNPFFNFHDTRNPYPSHERKYPIDLGMAKENVYLATITIPDSYEIEQLPEKKAFVLPEGAGKFIYSISAMGSKITLSCLFLINKTLFDAEEYSLLREIYNIYISKQSEQIVLKKKPIEHTK